MANAAEDERSEDPGARVDNDNLDDDRSKRKHSAVPCCCRGLSIFQRFTHVVEFAGILHREIGRPFILSYHQLNIDLGQIPSFVNQFLARLFVHVPMSHTDCWRGS